VRQLAQRDPALMAPAATEAQQLITTAAATRGAFDASAQVARARDRLLASIVAHGVGQSRIFTTVEVDPSPFGRLARAPQGLALEVRGDSSYVPYPIPAWRVRPGYPRIDVWIATLHLLYGQSLEERAGYERAYHHPDRALALERLAITLAPPFGEKDVPVLPVEGELLVRQSLAFFDNLRVQLAGKPVAVGL